MWERSTYVSKLHPGLNEACRSIIGCLSPKFVENVYLLAGIVPHGVTDEGLPLNNTYYHQTIYPSSSHLTYDMTRDYNKTDGHPLTTRKLTVHNSRNYNAFAHTTIIHTANIIFTNIILMADKHNIPKGKMHSNCRRLPEAIVCKITQRNNIRRPNTCDPVHKLLNEEITYDIQNTSKTYGRSI